MGECKTIEDVYDACCESCHAFIDCNIASVIKLLATAEVIDRFGVLKVEDKDGIPCGMEPGWEVATFWVRR